MEAAVKPLLYCTLALIALINPVSKIFVVSTLADKTSDHEVRRIAIKSTLIAAVILLLFIFIGNFLLRIVFHIEIYAFEIAGGFVLFVRGYEALSKGLFFEVDYNQKLEDLSVVPLASPMIAGPATITASVSFPAKYGLAITSVSVCIAIAFNLAIMLTSRYISRFIERLHVVAALIRITGLIVATIGVQMMLDGIGEYIKQL
jgi:multiple antibiotic resistance protein